MNNVSNLPRNILLNPGPATTTDKVKMSQVVPDICPRESEFGSLVASIRAKLLLLAGLSNKEYTAVLNGCSGTGAVESVISSIAEEKSKILILINGAYGDRALKVANCYFNEKNVSYLKFPENEQISLKALESKLEEINPDYLFFVHHETT